MIPKLIIISLFAIEYAFADRNLTTSQTLPSPPPAPEITTASATQNPSFANPITYPLAGSNRPIYQLQLKSRNGDKTQGDFDLREGEPKFQIHYTDEELNYKPVIRYDKKNNQVRGHFAVDKDVVKKLQEQQIQLKQPSDQVKEKSKGYIEFEFEIDNGKARKEENVLIRENNKPASLSLNQMISNLFPQGLADIFRFSYVAEPTNTKEYHKIQKKENNQFISMPSPSQTLEKPVSSPTPTPEQTSAEPAIIEKANTSALVTEEDVSAINAAAEEMKTPQEAPFPTMSSAESSYPFGEPINVDNRSDSDYEDHNLNLDEDNLIAPSKQESQQLTYHSPDETQIRAEHRDPDTLSSQREKQINVQIIQDSLGGYGQKLFLSPTKQLDEFQEEVEKKFNPNDFGIESEAASRKFLKLFKGRPVRPQFEKSEHPYIIKLKPIQPKSLLHTYIYSSESSKDSTTDVYPVDSKSYVAPLADSTSEVRERAQIHFQLKPVYTESPLHTSFYSSNNSSEETLIDNKGYKPDSQSTRVLVESPVHSTEFGGEQRPDSYSVRNKFDPSVPEEHLQIFSHQPYNKSYVIPTAQSPSELNERTQTQYQSRPIQADDLLNKCVYPPVFHRDEGPDSYNKSDGTTLNTFGHQTDNKLCERSPAEEWVWTLSKPKLVLPESSYTNLGFDKYTTDNKSDTTPLEQQIQISYEPEKDTEASENQETKQISSLHTDVFSSKPNNDIFVTRGLAHEVNNYIYSTTPYPQNRHHPQTVVEVQKSVNVHNKFITEKNGNLIEQHEIFSTPEKIYNRFPSFELLGGDTSDSLSDHPIRVAQAEEPYESESLVEPDSVLQQVQQQQSRKEQYKQEKDENQEEHQTREQAFNTVHFVTKPVPYPVKEEKLVPHPYPVERVVEKYVDRPVHIEHIVEKQVNVPYPVREVVEQIIDRPVPVEKIIDRPVHIPYPVRVDHFIDRPYAVQVPVHVAVPVPVHRYIDRPYPVEKIVEKPIHVPYPVEKVVERIVEKHVPVEVERIVEKPDQYVDRPYPVKNIVKRPIPIHIPVALTKSKNSKKKITAHKTGDMLVDVFELVPPPIPSAEEGQGYRTLPENIDFLLLDDYNGPLSYENQNLLWGQPVKRGTKSRNIKRSPEFGRNLRVEYGFKPPLVPSLEIDAQGLPLANKRSAD